jgi:hypothetical protein
VEAFGGKDALLTHLSGLAPNGALTIGDCRTYDAVEDISGIKNVLLRSLNESRPLIRLPAGPAASPTEWVFTGVDDAVLTLDGLFISGGDVVLSGNFKLVTISSCTFDPGTLKEDGSGFALSIDQRELAPTRLWIDGHVEELIVSRCVMGPVNERGQGMLDLLEMSDSIVQAIGTDPALTTSRGNLELLRSTIMGQGKVHQLVASDSILDDSFTVVDDQAGCIRFSAWASKSKLPQRYECVEIPPLAPVLVSRNFGDPAYGQLSDDADRIIIAGDDGSTIVEGAENGSEMGAFSSQQYPVKMRALQMKFEEYSPMGLEPVFINVT